MQRVYDSVCNSTSECKAEAVDEYPPQKKRRRSARLRSFYGLTQPFAIVVVFRLGTCHWQPFVATGSGTSRRGVDAAHEHSRLLGCATWQCPMH